MLFSRETLPQTSELSVPSLMIISCVALNVNGTKPSLSAVRTIQEEPGKKLSIEENKCIKVLHKMCTHLKTYYPTLQHSHFSFRADQNPDAAVHHRCSFPSGTTMEVVKGFRNF